MPTTQHQPQQTQTADVPRWACHPPLDPERIQRMWAMKPAARIAAAERGEFSFPELAKWHARFPHEVRTVDGEAWFIAILLADLDDD